MPFKSKAQQRKCYALKSKGEAGSWDCDEFSEHTDFDNLPEKTKKAFLGMARHGGSAMSDIISRMGFAAGRQKAAGAISEQIGVNLPHNILGAPIGMLTALATPTRDAREQAESNQDMWKNILIPGYAQHNVLKRIGHGAWGPEMENERRNIEREELEKEEAEAKKAAFDKHAGVGSELAGSAINPLNWYGGNWLGALAATATPTRNRREQAEHNQDFWKNLLIPGYGSYNAWKRIGHTSWGPEMEEEGRKLKQEQLQGEMDQSKAESERRAPKEDKEPEAKAAGDLFARLGRVAGTVSVR